MAEATLRRPGQGRMVRVHRADLPLSCPPPGEEEAWSLHPRVYLPIEATGEARCPYCGTRYLLED
jgi:uncharacterized Zn-finger protein